MRAFLEYRVSVLWLFYDIFQSGKQQLTSPDSGSADVIFNTYDTSLPVCTAPASRHFENSANLFRSLFENETWRGGGPTYKHHLHLNDRTDDLSRSTDERQQIENMYNMLLPSRWSLKNPMKAIFWVVFASLVPLGRFAGSFVLSSDGTVVSKRFPVAKDRESGRIVTGSCRRHYRGTARVDQEDYISEEHPHVSWFKSRTTSSVSRSAFLVALAAGVSLPMVPQQVAAASSGSYRDGGEQLESPTLMTTTRTRATKTREIAWQESISGFVAGGTLTATKTVVKYPLDTATVRLQMPNSDYSFRQLFRLFDGSYRGVANPLLANIPAGAIFFGVKDACKENLRVSTNLPRWVQTTLAVAVAQVPYWAVRNPSEVVKTRQQANIDGYNVGPLEAYQKVIQDSMTKNGNATTGLEGLYTGYWENILYAFPADVIKFVCYDQFSRGRKNLPPGEGAMAGAAATAIAQFVTTPLDVVRNRIMAVESKFSGNDRVTPSYLDSLTTLARDEGLPGLFAGSSPRVGKAILSGAIQFATYEETKQDIAKAFERRQQQ